MIYEFTIQGTHESKSANPIPKAKLTKGQQWTAKAHRYVFWKAYVVRCLMDAHKAKEQMLARTIHLYKHPFVITERGRMDIEIEWGSRAHRPDPENVFGSIADALFHNDQKLAGSFDFKEAEDGKARVKVKINFS